MQPIPYHPYSNSFNANPHPVYKRMRDEAPAFFVEDINAWALSRFDDVWEASMDRGNYTATQGTHLDALVMNAPTPRAFVFMDPPEHRQYRNLVNPSYSSEAVKPLESKVRELTRTLMRQHLERGELEVYSLATKVGAHIIADIIGLRRPDMDIIRGFLDIYFGREKGVIGPTPSGLQAYAELEKFALDLVREYRRNPPPDSTHLHAWMNTPVNGKLMTDEEVFFTIFSLAVTGSDTLALTSAGTVYYLYERPQLLASVRDDRSLIPLAFAETARFDQPTNVLGRKVIRNVKLHGQTLQVGQSVLFLFASACRDEREYENPDEYHILRTSKRTLAFGAGIHACLGKHLALLEGKVILEEILAAIPDFELHRDQCQRQFGEFLQGYCRVPIRFSPR